MTEPPVYNEPDTDAVMACVALCDRAGAKAVELGWLNDEPPYYWWCTAEYKGTKITVDGKPTAADAADGLAYQILEGGRCMHCGLLVTTLGPDVADRCCWHRNGPTWLRGCLATHRANPLAPDPKLRGDLEALNAAGQHRARPNRAARRRRRR